MDAFNDPTVTEVVGMTSAQVAKTTIVENVAAYHVQHDPAPMMILQPTLEMAETFSKDRLEPLIRDTPSIRERMIEHGSRKGGNTILHKKFHGGHITMAGANSPASLASRPIRILLCDEVDRYLKNVGNEGNPIKLATKRTTAFWNSKVGYFSTPTVEGNSPIAALYEDSDQRKFFVPCPDCDHMHVLLWENFKWAEGDPTWGTDGRQIRRATSAWFECPECGGEIHDVDRLRAIKQGEWRATAPFHGRAGFWLWQGYSPFVKAVDTANEWLAALGKPLELQTVMNTVRGECWVDSGEAPDWERIRGRAGGYKPGEVPDGVLFLTAGVDVQADRLEMSVYGWGRGKCSWLIDHRVLDGDTAKAAVWSKLEEEIGRQYHTAGGQPLSILITSVDAAYETPKAYAFARRHGSSRVIAVFGRDTGSAMLWQGRPVDEKRDGKKIRRGFRPFLMNSSLLKSETYGFLKQDPPTATEETPAGWIAFPQGMPDEFFMQLTAESLATRTVKGYTKREWKKDRERNEALDCRSLARAAAEHVGISRFSEKNWAAFEEFIAAPVVVKPVRPEPAAAPPGSGEKKKNSRIMGQVDW